MDLTGKGQPFSYIPIAYRIFNDEILNFPPRRWAEMLFVNQAGQVCAVLFHGFSVERLQAMLGDLYYEEVGLCELALTVTPEPRSNEHGSYFVATFSYQVLKSKQVETLNAIIDALPPLYREETLTGDALIYTSKNYYLPETVDGEETPAAESKGKEAAVQSQRA